jgi:hypothetical protein
MTAVLKSPLLRTFAAAAFALVAAACSSLGLSNSALEPKGPAVGLYELRIYTAAEGKMDALHARMRTAEVALFRKHGMTPVGFFTPAPIAGQPADNRLFYILGYKDRAARDKAWTDFAADPEWKSAYAASQANGSLTSAISNTFLTLTDYSPKMAVASPTTRLFELRTYHAQPNRIEDLHKRFRDHTLRIFKKHAMTSVLYWRPVDGQPAMVDKMIYLLAFPDQAARNKSWTEFSADPEWKKVSDDSQKTGPMLVSPGGVVSVQLTPTDYSPLR